MACCIKFYIFVMWFSYIILRDKCQFYFDQEAYWILFFFFFFLNSLLGLNGINDELIETEFTCHTNEVFLSFLSRCARWCQCQPITSLLAALWALCTFLQTALTSIGSGLLPAWMRKHLRDILSSWTLLNLWWVSLSNPVSLQRHFYLLSFYVSVHGT